MDEFIEQNKIESVHIDFENEPINDKIKYLWNDKLELSAKDIGNNSKGYKIMHLNQAQKTKKYYNILMFLGIFLAPLSGLFSGINSIIYPDEDPTLPIISILCSLIAGFSISILKFARYDDSSIANKQAAARYTGIESSVRRQLSLYRKDRIQANLYMKWLEDKFEELFISAPLLPSDSYKEYSDIAGEMGVLIPNQYKNTIKINTEFESDISKNLSNKDEITINNKEIITKINENQQDIKIVENKTNINVEIPRSSGMASFPELNQYSDGMIEYEIKRMMGLL